MFLVVLSDYFVAILDFLIIFIDSLKHINLSNSKAHINIVKATKSIEFLYKIYLSNN